MALKKFRQGPWSLSGNLSAGVCIFYVLAINAVCLEGCTYINKDCTIRCVCRNDQISCNTTYSCSDNAECRLDDGIQGCYCNEGYIGDGTTCIPLYRDCYDAYEAGNTEDGVYTILPSNWPGDPFNVLCNMTCEGGGWTVFQRRIDGVTDFYRNWESYKNGFGSLENDFWIGNEKLYYLTKQRNYELRVDLVTFEESPLHQEYPHFEISDECGNYQLTLDRGTALRTGMSKNHLNYFSTFDRDNDRCSVYSCAERHRGGWWYGETTWCPSCYSSDCGNFLTGTCYTACTDSNLNGDYTGGTGQSIIWYRDASGRHCNMKYSDMKIRPVVGEC